MSDRVVALLDRPISKSMGMVGLVVARRGGQLTATGVRDLERKVVPPTELEDLAAGGHAIPVDGPELAESTSSAVALWIGADFEHESIRHGVSLPPLPSQATGALLAGKYWDAPSRHVWRVLDSWVVQAFRKVVGTNDSRLAELMSWALPDRLETHAARWLTAPSASVRSRALDWWVRLERDRGQATTTSEALSDSFRRLIQDVETSQHSNVIGFTAPAGGGDKEIAAALASMEQLLSVSFGNWLKTKAAEPGVTVTRQLLQHLGQKIIDERGALAFCLDVLESVPSPLPQQRFIIEGIRHLDILKALESLVGPDRLFLAYVDRPISVRKELLRAKEGLSEDQIKEVLRDETEKEIPLLQKRADIVLDGERGAEVESRRLLASLSS